jgi:hypothetical protein
VLRASRFLRRKATMTKWADAGPQAKRPGHFSLPRWRHCENLEWKLMGGNETAAD